MRPARIGLDRLGLPADHPAWLWPDAARLLRGFAECSQCHGFDKKRRDLVNMSASTDSHRSELLALAILRDRLAARPLAFDAISPKKRPANDKGTCKDCDLLIEVAGRSVFVEVKCNELVRCQDVPEPLGDVIDGIAARLRYELTAELMMIPERHRQRAIRSLAPEQLMELLRQHIEEHEQNLSNGLACEAPPPPFDLPHEGITWLRLYLTPGERTPSGCYFHPLHAADLFHYLYGSPSRTGQDEAGVEKGADVLMVGIPDLNKPIADLLRGWPTGSPRLAPLPFPNIHIGPPEKQQLPVIAVFTMVPDDVEVRLLVHGDRVDLEPFCPLTRVR